MADALTNTAGGFRRLLMAATRLVVALRRLSTIRAFWAELQRRDAIDSPARLITAPAPSSARLHESSLPSGFHSRCVIDPGDGGLLAVRGVLLRVSTTI